MRKLSNILVVLALSTLLWACGQKGDLYLPDAGIQKPVSIDKVNKEKTVEKK